MSSTFHIFPVLPTFSRFAILGLTFQYTTSRISREYYESYHSIYNDEVSRLNRPQAEDVSHHALNTINPDDLDVRATDELRFTLFRHWNLYDAMFHSSYVASKLGIWKERGRKRLTGLLAKMGYVYCVQALDTLSKKLSSVDSLYHRRSSRTTIWIWTSRNNLYPN